MTGGCYVFSLVPTTYAATGEQAATTGYSGLPDRLLPALLDKDISTFTTVPLILEGFMAIYNSDNSRREQIRAALKKMKAYMCGGAKTNPDAIEWAIEIGLPLNLGIGMTELGRKCSGTRVVNVIDVTLRS
jgi:acyl-coenzyme A synthetase/AMP-(fatty) acid ligase